MSFIQKTAELENLVAGLEDDAIKFRPDIEDA